MSSSPGLPPQQATTTNLRSTQLLPSLPSTSQLHQQHHPHLHNHHHQQQHLQPPLPTVPSVKPLRSIPTAEESESETVVLAGVVPNVRKNVDDPPCEYERGRRRRTSEARAPADQDRPHRTRPLRQGPAKRRPKDAEHDDEEYSSDLSSAPSRSSRPNSPSQPHPMRRRVKRDIGFTKRKTNSASTASEGDNSDDGNQNANNINNNRLRLRKRRRSVMDSSPPRRRIKSSPPISPQPLGSPSKNTRTREKIHLGQRLKHRKIPPPIATHDDQSSSSSRENSPSAIPRPRRPQSVRTPGSPMSTSHKPKRDTAGRTHLHRACQRGAVAEVGAILYAGKEFLNAEDNAGYLPLHEACLHGHLEVVKILIDNGAWLDVPSQIEQDTPLLDAVDNGHADVVKYLLELGADPRKRNKQGQTALDANESNRDTPEVFGEIEELLKVAINKLRSKRSSDDEAARASAAADSHSSSRDASVTSPVHQSPPAPSAPTGTRRRNARTEQSRKDLLWLDAGKNGLQKLREKAREGDKQMVHALLERGTKPDTESLIGAIKGGHEDTVSLLLAYGDMIVDPEPGLRDGHRKMRDSSMPVGEETPMLAAIGRGNLTVLGYLLENGVNPRRLDGKGKSYIDIARDREGERWQDEVEMLKKAWDKAGGSRTSEKTRRHSPVVHRNMSPKPKKVNDAKVGSRPRTNSSLSSATTARRSASANPSRYEEALAASDQEITAEPLGPPKNRGRKGKRSESESLVPPIAKKKRRLISGKDLANEESLARSSQEPSRSVPPETDIDSSEKKSVVKKARTNTDELKTEPKQPGRKLRMGSEDTKMGDLLAPASTLERITLKSYDSNLLRPDNIPSKDRKPPTLGGKRDRTRSPTSHSDSGRRPDLDDPKRQRKMAEHKTEKYDSDSTVKRVPVKEEGTSKRKLHPGEVTVRRDSPHNRRPSLSIAESSDREEERRRLLLREKDELDRQERRDRERRERAREEEERRALAEAEARERRRQNHLRMEMESILSKARRGSERAREDEVINRELLIRKKRKEQERIEREIRERDEREQEEREEREERERGRVERELREREIREREEAVNRRIERQAAEAREREAREREVREREMREREANEKEVRDREAREREAEQKRLELKHREEEERRHEEERKRDEIRKREEEHREEESRRRLEEEELQKRLAEEQRRKEEAEAERARHEALENQRRAAEAERKRKAAEEERKRQEFERAQREKETRDRRVAEQLQQQLAAERKRVEELAEKRRSEEEEERRRELARRDALPFALRQAEENYTNGIVLDGRGGERFLPLYSATFPGPHPLMANATPTKAVNGFGVKPQLWILNVQAALVLGITDLEFSNYADVRHRRVTDEERLRMWSVLSVMLCESVYSSQRSIRELEKLRREERKKFLDMSPVFWMRVEDFRNIISTDSKYTNLANINIRTINVDLSCSNYSTPVKLNNGNGNGNGPMTPMSASITKEEMALRLERLFGTPPPRTPLYQLSQVQAQTSVNQTLLPSSLTLPNNNSASMPPPTPINATNAASASTSLN